MANPYRKNPSFFGSEKDHDYIIDSGSSKERTIKANAEQAKVAADQEKARENKPIKSATSEIIKSENGPVKIPKDLREDISARKLSKDYTQHSQRGAKEGFNHIQELLKDDKFKSTDIYKKIQNLDLNNPDKVIDIAREILDYPKESTYACYNIAGVIAGILNQKGIPFRCFSGSASKTLYNKTRDINAIFANHTWIETDKAIYEYFDDLKTIHHYNITDEIKF